MRACSFIIVAAAGWSLMAIGCGSSSVGSGAGLVSGGDLMGEPVVGEAALAPIHQRMIERLAQRGEADPGRGRFSACFAPGTPDAVVEAFTQRLQPVGFFQASRWGPTALDPAGGVLGRPTTITYAIVPDGTTINGFNGEPQAPSNLVAYLNGIYGSPDVWQPIVQSVFDRWGQLIGVTYVLEAADDGVPLASEPGVAGVRADVRIGGHFIDGPFNVLAYNFFPDGGDMVIDTGDTYFTDTFGESIRLRNVLSHEHGHGMGQAHVCPINQTKIMEPFISVAYDGPREDDIRSGQSFYGDRFEPNDIQLDAADLGVIVPGGSQIVGALPPPVVPFASSISLREGEDDWFKFTLAEPASVTVTVTPIGRSYEDSPQACADNAGRCCAGDFTDSLRAGDLGVEVIPAGGGGPASATGRPVGEAETLTLNLPAGVNSLRAFLNSATAPPQMYTLTVEAASLAFAAELVEPAPTSVQPGLASSIEIQVVSGQQTLDLQASGLLYRDSDSAPYSSSPLADLGGGRFAATLPAFACGSAPQFYFNLVGSGGATLTLPASAPAAPFALFVGEIVTVFIDNMEIDRGWSVATTATAGAWERVDPVGTAAAPEDDNTPEPGVACWVTGQGAPGGGLGENDVDNGATQLISPLLDLSAAGDYTFTYARWYSNGAGAGPYSDTFRVDVSTDDGATWTSAEVVGPGGPADANTNPGWINASFTLASLGLSPSGQVRVRFTAEDAAPGSLIEAALDDFLVIRRSCTAPVCPADFNGDGFVDPDDLSDYIGCFFEAPPCPRADVNNDGFADPDDLSDYIGLFFSSGC